MGNAAADLPEDILYGLFQPTRSLLADSGHTHAEEASEIAAGLAVSQHIILHFFSLGGPVSTDTVWIAEELCKSELLTTTRVTTHDLAVVSNSVVDLRARLLIERDPEDSSTWRLTEIGKAVAEISNQLLVENDLIR